MKRSILFFIVFVIAMIYLGHKWAGPLLAVGVGLWGMYGSLRRLYLLRYSEKISGKVTWCRRDIYSENAHLEMKLDTGAANELTAIVTHWSKPDVGQTIMLVYESEPNKYLLVSKSNMAYIIVGALSGAFIVAAGIYGLYYYHFCKDCASVIN